MKNIIKKSSMLTVLGVLAIVGIASAALLTTYVTTTGTATIDQSVVFTTGDQTSHSYSYTEVAGNTKETSDEIQNRSDATAPIKFETTHSPDGIGIDTSYWSTLVLENKDSNWNIISDNMEGLLTYELAANEFNYEFEATGLNTGTDYSLIYYADKPNRFVNWGGNNPGALIATFTTDTNGDILAITGSTNLKINLPDPNDANYDENDYCASDGYDLCRGAKIWLVLSTSYDSNNKKLIGWNPTSYLFETDMITYNDVNTKGEALYLGTGKLSFFIRNTFDIALSPDTYTITTDINPVQ